MLTEILKYQQVKNIKYHNYLEQQDLQYFV